MRMNDKEVRGKQRSILHSNVKYCVHMLYFMSLKSGLNDGLFANRKGIDCRALE